MLSPYRFGGLALATAAVALLAACASTPPENPQLTHLESEMKDSYADKYIAEFGHADLARAEASLTAARTSMRDGSNAETQHDFAMAQGYIDLAAVHGKQEQTKADIAALKTRQAELALIVHDREAMRAQKSADDVLAAQAAQASSDAASAAALQKTADMQEQLRIYNLKITELGATLVLRDVMFATDSSDLRAGASNRLAPLISYLKSSPTTSVRIEGHTDSTGNASHNDDLSLNRANSVMRALQDGGLVTNAIQTYGMGQSKPVASNETVSGREQNRRVEITLIQAKTPT